MWLARLHPLLVHFPVALFVTGVLFEIYGRLRREPVVETAGWFNLRLGVAFALVAAVVGFLGLLQLELKGKAASFAGYHILSALATLACFGLALWLFRRRSRRWAWALYHVLLVAGLCAVLSTGYWGGELVHRFGVATHQPVD